MSLSTGVSTLSTAIGAKIKEIMTALSGKQATLVSGTNIKTVNGTSILGSGNISVSASSVPWSGVTSTPTTLSGYGITDAATSTHTHSYVASTNDNYTIAIHDSRSSNTSTDMGDRGVKFDFKSNTSTGLSDGGTYHATMTVQNWSDSSGGDTHNLGFTDNGNVWYRNATIGGTWGSWYNMWHSGNDGSGSGLDADTLDGYHLSTTRNSANTVPVRDANGYLNLGWINTTSGNTTSTLTDIYVNTNDGYIRKATPAHFRSQITDSYYAAQKATSSVYGGAKMSLSGTTLTITTT